MFLRLRFIRYFISPSSLFSLWLCAMLDHFRYPAPLFSVWRQACWYNLHLAEMWLREIHLNIINSREPLPTIGAVLAAMPHWEEDVSESSPATSPTSTATSSPSPVSADRPTVAQKEQQNQVLHEQAVELTVGIGSGHKPIWLNSPGPATSPPRKQGRSQSRKDKGKKPK